MAVFPERAATALKVGTALAVGSLAVAGTAESRDHPEKTAHKKHVNVIEQDRLAHLAMMAHGAAVTLKREEREQKAAAYHLPHHGPHHSSTHPMNVHVKLIPESKSLRIWENTLGYCESRNNYGEDTGNGFRGYYQFEQEEWDRVAEETDHKNLVGIPVNEATPGAQDTMIVVNTVLAEGGLASQNPGCYASYASKGLSEKPPGISESEIHILEHGGYLEHSVA